jgi:uncharacterized protein (DUF433 family)
MAAAHDFDYRPFFTRNRQIMGGETVFAGTRVPLRTILGSLAAGDAPDVLLKSFPSLTREHLRAAIAFAAASAREDLPTIESQAAA